MPILGSDIAGLPNYLLSAEDILNEAKRNDECINEIYVDNRIDRSIRLSQRLYFAHCINNGGFSQLMIDFHPNTDGQVGQVIRFVHDPDEYRVIASSFDDYLQKLIEYECEHLKNIENYLD